MLELTKFTDTSALRYNDTCDKIDYLVAVACGTVSGLIDAFLVGSPKDGSSVLMKWTDKQADKCVEAFARMQGWKGGSTASAIGFLERKYPVNYDQRSGKDVFGLFHMNTVNHHMKSLAHSPSPVGLFFSILNQFTGTATFLDNGTMITVKTDTQELVGGTPLAKIFCGFANWVGHLMSDMAGSSGGRGNGGRGSGIVMPFYELFGLCNFGEFGQYRQSLATLATRAFENGYDARFGATMAIPVILCEASIRLFWGIRQYFGYHRPIAECIPTDAHDSLRVMLLVGHGMLCTIDGIDALIRSGGDPLAFFLHINLVGWCRLVKLALKEVCIRCNIQGTVDALKRINAALDAYLAELQKIDLPRFQAETKLCADVSALVDGARNEYELSVALRQACKLMNITLCWEETHDSFDDFMSDKNARMVFK